MSPTSYQTAPPRGEGVQDSEPRRSSHLGIWARSFSLCACAPFREWSTAVSFDLVRAQPSMRRGAVAILAAMAPLVVGCSTGAQTTTSATLPASAQSTISPVTAAQVTAAGSATTPASTTPCGTASAPRQYRHVIWIWMENHQRNQVIGDPGGTVRVRARSRVRHGSSLLGRRQPVAAQLPRRHVGKHPRGP